MNASVRDSNAFLFVPRPAYRFRNTVVPVSVDYDPTAGQNPTYGASINYYLKSAPGGEIKIRIENASGQIVRTLTGTKTAGVNRVYWDLRGEQTKEVRLRTSPAYAPEIRNGPESWRLAPDGGRISVLLPPGTYTVKLLMPGAEANASGQTLSQQLVVKKDPNSEGSEADINAQLAMLFELRNDLEDAANMVNQIEVIRSQLAAITALLGPSEPANAGSAGILPATSTQRESPSAQAPSADYIAIKQPASDLDKKLIDIEDNLIQRRLTGQGQDTVRWPPKLISKINYLANGLAGADFPPTSQHREVQAMLREQLTALRRRLDEVLNKDLDSFNKQLRDRNIQNVIR